MRRRTRVAILPILLAVAGLALLTPAAGAMPLAPESPQSPNADDLRTAYWVALIVAGVLALAINAALVAAVVRFRAARGRTPAQVRSAGRIQLRAGALLGLVAVAVLVFGLIFTVKARDVSPSGPEGLEASSVRTAQIGLAPRTGDPAPLDITVSGQQWLWRYEYPDGTFSYYEMVVPVDTTVVLHIASTDVVHRWWIPAMGGKFDAVPGRLNETWFRADEEGVYDGQSAAFSGPGYPTMRAQVKVVSVPEYETWLEDQADAIQQAQEAVQEGPPESGGGT